jgi:hypothetical protein
VPLADILFEQLGYLITHVLPDHLCAVGCEECIRLRMVELWLMKPFAAKANVANMSGD